MAFLNKITLAVSRVHPGVYLSIYLAAIPAFGLLYFFLAPHGFYAPYARYEPGGIADAEQLASILEAALRRSVDPRADQDFVAGDWKLDLHSLRVDTVNSTDGTQVSFRVRFTANGT